MVRGGEQAVHAADFGRLILEQRFDGRRSIVILFVRAGRRRQRIHGDDLNVAGLADQAQNVPQRLPDRRVDVRQQGQQAQRGVRRPALQPVPRRKIAAQLHAAPGQERQTAFGVGEEMRRFGLPALRPGRAGFAR